MSRNDYLGMASSQKLCIPVWLSLFRIIQKAARFAKNASMHGLSQDRGEADRGVSQREPEFDPSYITQGSEVPR